MSDGLETETIYPHLEIVGEDVEAAVKAFIAAVKSALPRKGLTAAQARELEFDAEIAASRLNAFRNASNCAAAIQLAMSSLFIGLRAVLSEDQLQNLRNSDYRERQRQAAIKKAEKSRRSSPKRGHARHIFLQHYSALKDKSPNAIANFLMRNWNPDGLSGVVECPDVKTLTGYAKDFLRE